MQTTTLLRPLRRAVRTLMAGLVLTVSSATPASAHSAANTPSSNYETRIISIATTPSTSSTAPFELQVVDGGSRLALTWRSGPEISVPGYDGDPYLRVGPDGAFENLNSKSTYLNRSRNGNVPIPADVNPADAPRWRRIANRPVLLWHDHRAHIMAGDPPIVTQFPDQEHIISEQKIPFTQGSATTTVTVQVRWIPGPSLLPWVGVGIAACAVALLAGLRRIGPGRGPVRDAVVAIVAGVLVAIDVVHLVGIAFGVAGTVSEQALRMVTIGYGSIAAWIVGTAGIVLVLRRRVDGFYLTAFAAALITIVGGLSDLGLLAHTTVPFAFPAWSARAAVTLTIALGVALAALSIRAASARTQQPATGVGAETATA